MNTILFKTLIDGYNAISYTHNYIFGFTYKGMIYMSFQNSEILPYIATLDTSPEKNGGKSIRFKPTVKQKLALLPEAKPVCSEEYFNALCKEKYINAKGKPTKYNRGEVFEKLMTEYFGQVWEKDKVPFTDGPDVVGNGIPYQVKFEKATFTCELWLANLTLKKKLNT